MKISVIAGEKSGDNYGSLLIDCIRKIKPDVFVIGAGGEGIRERTDLFVDLPYGKMGFSGVISSMPLFYRKFKEVKEILDKENPSFIVFIDNPGFNLKLAASLGEKFPCFYYIPPKVWAHNYKRIYVIKRYIKAVIPIFPFEQDIYQKEDIPVFWFGHPVIDLVKADETEKERDIPVIGLLPGSREEEVRYLLPVFLRILKIISGKRKVKALLSASDSAIRKIEERILKEHSTNIDIIEGSPHSIIREVSLLLATSGTVNLEVALYGKPLLVFYKTTYLNYLLAKIMVKLDVISPVNLMLEKKVVPEYIQHFSYRRIVGDINNILDKGLLYRNQKDAFARIKIMIGRENVSERVADFLIKWGGS
ncbi:MAG TPA: hypothetical protein PLQ41_06180 [bacterium]|nr:hypothetical protein [bacterium]HPP30057.1 hypothetical protein [bacterium]